MAVAEQCLHSVKAFLFSPLWFLLVRSLGMCRKLGGDTARTADPNWPKGYSITHSIMLSNKTGGKSR